MHRFFVDPQQIKQQRVYLAPDQAHQVRNVLRLQPGEAIIVLDNQGWEMEAELTLVDRQEVVAAIVSRSAAPGEPRLRLTLYQSMLKRDKFEWVLQKGTELGISRFVPVITRRSLVRDAAALKPSKQARWEKILQEAAEQCGRGRIPQLVAPLSFAEAVDEAVGAGPALIAWEAGDVSLDKVLSSAQPKITSSLALFIGPEGGFDDVEVEQAVAVDARPFSLGPRILRTETAAIVAAALVMYEAGEL